MESVRSSHTDIVRMLLEHKSDIFAVNHDGMTAKDMVMEKDVVTMADVFYEARTYLIGF